MRESVQVFIAPPDPAVLRRRLEGRGTDSAEAIDARLEVAEQELAAQDEFAYRVVNDDLDRAADELEGIVRAELGLPTRLPEPNDQTTRRQASGARRLPLRRGRRLGEARASDQQLLPQPRRGQLRRVPAADGRDPRRRGTTSRWRSKSSPRASSNTSTAPSARRFEREPGEEPDGQSPAWRQRWDRRLQGAGAGAPGDRRRPRRARADDRDGDPLRRRRLLRGDRRRPGADLRVRARPDARRLPRRGAPRARPDRPPRAGRQLRRLPGRAGLGQHDRQAGRRPRRLDADHLLPRLRRRRASSPRR